MASRGPRRPTIAEIAERAGVSAGAVSYALNDRPGVSDDTRARILGVAREIGWVPSAAARALRGGDTSTVGLVITREPAMLGIEPFFMAFVAGIEQVISDAGYALLLQVTADPARVVRTYREWWSARRVDGVFLTDLEIDDERIGLVQKIGLPAVVVGDPAFAGGLPAVGSDDAGAVREAVRRLGALGHRRLGHITGPERFVHTRIRAEAIGVEAERLGLEVVGEISTDYSLGAGAEACGQLVQGPARATAIICDNDLTAVGAVRRAGDLGLRVPRDLSVLAWDDSPLCQVSDPPLSALGRDVSAYGSDVARALLGLIKDGASVTSAGALPRLVDRGSLGVAPH